MALDKNALTKEAMVDLADKIFHYKWIAKSVGLSEDTLQRWRDNDPQFADKLEEARGRFIKNNMRKARPEFLLQTADRPTFGEKKEINVKADINLVEAIIVGTGLRADIEAERETNLLEGEDGRESDGDIPITPETKA